MILQLKKETKYFIEKVIMLENHVDHIPIPREELLEDVEERLDEEKDEELVEGVKYIII
jgi:hypothetical protein